MLECTPGEILKTAKNSHVIYPMGKPRIPHLLCCQGFAVKYYSFTLDAADLWHPRLLQRQGLQVYGLRRAEGVERAGRMEQQSSDQRDHTFRQSSYPTTCGKYFVYIPLSLVRMALHFAEANPPIQKSERKCSFRFSLWPHCGHFTFVFLFKYFIQLSDAQ